VYGVNPRSSSSHRRFATKHQFPFPLLVDENQQAARLYNSSGVWVKRTVYLIGPDGKIKLGRRGKPTPRELMAAL
jgi:peroxiredoxin Q/BCP